MKKFLKQSPLVTAIFEVRFTTIPKLKDSLESVHQALMPLGYAHSYVSERTGHDIRINGANQEVKAINLGSRCDYLNLERTQKVVLENERLVIQTAKYTTFEDFYEYIVNILEVVTGALPNLEHTGIERIGLRYVDTVLPSEGTKLEEYIIPEFLGPRHGWLTSELPPISNVQSTAQTAIGILRTQFEQLYWLHDENKSVRLVPVDLIHNNEPREILYRISEAKIEKMKAGQRFGIFNSDYIQALSPAKAFELNYVFETLKRMYKDSSAAFWNTLTDYAREEWEETDKIINTTH